jgi:hypothetical protein
MIYVFFLRLKALYRYPQRLISAGFFTAEESQ